MLPPILGVIAAYLIGSIPFGYLIARARGVDIFKAGSGNIGATNVGRVIGRKWGLLVFALDVLKGALPIAAMRWLTDVPEWAVAAGLAAMLGHLFPIYLRFHGGKGVATGFGVVAVLLPAPAAIAFLIWLTVVATTRYVSLASIAAVIALIVARLLGTHEPFASAELVLSLFCIATGVLVIVKHRTNVSRLLDGTESPIADSALLESLGRVLHLVAVGLWLGAGVMFSFIVAPILFATLDTETAGTVVSKVFPPYFAIQAVCGVIALVTAAAWMRSGRADRWRYIALCVAMVCVLIGWPLVGIVSEMRAARHSSNPAVAEAAKASFGLWHGISLLLNLATLVMVTAALALASRLPAPMARESPPSR